VFAAGALKSFLADGPTKPPTVPPLALFLLVLTGCAWLKSPQAPQGGLLAVKDIMCAIAHDQEPLAQVLSDCNIIADAANEVQQILASSHAREAEAARAACTPSGPGK
jgi:hypothetical protein